ncbi:MAG: MerR family transcriptional regulator [Lachnospiraceae bacterium]|nr:MerR family transcriptional regulator [Lachnospiraceae bacterium]
MEKQRYMISDAAALVNVESHVLRYWEEELELAIPRNEMGHRYYTKENIDQFFQIKKWKEEGYQLKAIKLLVHNGGNEELLNQMPELQETVPDQAKQPKQPPLKTAAHPADSRVADNTRRMEQFQNMMTEIVRRAIEENNQELSREMGEEVRTRILKELNYLAREQEEAQEERYRKLDELLRQNLKVKKKKQREKRLFHKNAVVQPN